MVDSCGRMCTLNGYKEELLYTARIFRFAAKYILRQTVCQKKKNNKKLHIKAKRKHENR